MKVCLIGCLPVELGGRVNGGIASHIYELYKNLKLQGVNVSIFSNEIEKPISKDVLSYNCKLQQIVYAVFGIVRFRTCKVKGYSIKESLKILADANRIASIKNLKETVFHVHSLNNTAAISCEIANVEYIVTDHAYWQGNKCKGLIKENVKC
ncbi:glycosyltransferase, partial [Shewanella sp.]|nr:glycosyltransferase [Shewanella sp.]